MRDQRKTKPIKANSPLHEKLPGILIIDNYSADADLAGVAVGWNRKILAEKVFDFGFSCSSSAIAARGRAGALGELTAKILTARIRNTSNSQ